MQTRLKSWESPRRQGRNDKGKGGAARKRQLKKRQQMLRQKLKQNGEEKDRSSFFIANKIANIWRLSAKRIVRVLGLVSLLFLLGWNREVLAAETIDKARIFEVHCTGCHPNGSNIIRRGKNLQLKALQRNKVDSIEAISTLVINGKGAMSAFGDRLTPEEIVGVSEYVLERAASSWKSVK
jgi:cytochrome c6